MTVQRLNRDLVRDIAVPWLQGKNAYRLQYALALMLDDALDMQYAAVEHKFPGYVSGESLPYIGRERGLIRGLFETDARYATRLLGWIESWKRRGSPQELMRQLRAYHAPELGEVQIVYRNGTRYVGAPSGTITRDMLADWQPDDRPDLWCRIQVFIRINVYHLETDLVRRARAVDDLTRLVGDFTPAHCGVEYTIIGDDAGTWSEPPPLPGETADAWSSPGTWSDAGGDSTNSPIHVVVEAVQ